MLYDFCDPNTGSLSCRFFGRRNQTISYGRVPAGSVVVASSLPAKEGTHSLNCAVIVKQVDAKTRQKVGITALLRSTTFSLRHSINNRTDDLLFSHHDLFCLHPLSKERVTEAINFISQLTSKPIDKHSSQAYWFSKMRVLQRYYYGLSLKEKEAVCQEYSGGSDKGQRLAIIMDWLM